MSDTIPSIPTQTPVVTDNQLPTAAIVCIAVGGYVVLVVIILVLRQCCLIYKTRLMDDNFLDILCLIMVSASAPKE